MYLRLLGIVLATGLVVDDGIVVTENIYKKMEAGMDKWQAAKEGSKEIYFAVIATSITLAVVFLAHHFPAGFCRKAVPRVRYCGGRSCADFCFCFAYAYTGAEREAYKKDVHKHSWFYSKTEPFFRGMENGYTIALTSFMKVRWMAFVIIACLWWHHLFHWRIPSIRTGADGRPKPVPAAGDGTGR